MFTEEELDNIRNGASERLKKLRHEYINSKFKVGEKVTISGKYLINNRSQDKNKPLDCVIKEAHNDYLVVYNGWHEGDTCKVDIKNCSKVLYDVGANPYPEKDWWRFLSLNRSSIFQIVHQILKTGEWKTKDKDGNDREIDNLNYNPYVFGKDGKKLYYQRDFCWDEKDEMNFIESAYNGLNLGAIIVREHSYEYIEKAFKNGDYNVAFYDIVDGKQRLHTIERFIGGEFHDLHGNYYNDLSPRARHKFLDTGTISLGILSERCTDLDTINTFININNRGKVMSGDDIKNALNIEKLI